jgi:hypothetical protein
MELWIFGAALALAGCSSTMGTNYDPNAVAALQPGMSEAAVVKALGKPNSITVGPNGGRILLWMHTKGTAIPSRCYLMRRATTCACSRRTRRR